MNCLDPWHQFDYTKEEMPNRERPCLKCGMTEVYHDHSGFSDTMQGYEATLREVYLEGYEAGLKASGKK
jgi:hypothetical protein